MCHFIVGLLKFNQKMLITLSAFLLMGLGIGSLVVDIQAEENASYHEFAAMLVSESDGKFDIDKVLIAMIAIVSVTILACLVGVYSAWGERKGSLFCFSFFVFLVGALSFGLMVGVIMFLKGTFPTVVKETNRICRNEVQMKHALKCGVPPASAAPTAPVAAAPPQAPVAPAAPQPPQPPAAPAAPPPPPPPAPTHRRLATVAASAALRALRRLEPHIGSWANLKSLEPRQWNGTLAEEREISVTEMVAGVKLMRALRDRRLVAGTTEVHFITQTCEMLKVEVGEDSCVSECALLAKLCVEPDGFDANTACVCDSLGPRKLNSGGTKLIKAQCPPGMEQSDGTCGGSFCSIPDAWAAAPTSLTEEGCWVLPTTMCDDQLGRPYPGPCTTTPCGMQFPFFHTGPCSEPVPRSKILADGEQAVTLFVGLSLALSALMLLTSLCGCCLFCEVHTGKSADEHAHSVIYGDDDEKDNFGHEGVHLVNPNQGYGHPYQNAYGYNQGYR